ncbi:MAG: heavy metal translocating P-type ATPase, partial [Candidatus Atribacteria bacterium]
MALDQRKKIELKISGMTCAMCATTIEKSLINLNGVINAQVNLGNESVAVEYDFLKLKFTDLGKAIKDAGYQIINEKVVLKIGGMTCATCVKTIENSLLRLDGIIEVNTDLAGEKAIVIYNPNIVTQADMRRTIEETGYQFLGIEGEKTEDFEKVTREKDLKEKRNRIIVGFTTGTLLMILMYIPINLPISTAYLMLLISTPAFIYISHPIFAAAYRSLKNKSLNMDVMYSMGIGVAFGASLLATFNFILSSRFLFYETAIFLATFLTMGRYLESRAKGKTSEAIKKLMGLQPKTAGVLKLKNIDIEILYFRDCPNYNKSAEQVKDALKKLNISTPIKLTEVNKENFRDYSFYGSPTILVNKRDIEGKVNKLFVCRVYNYNNRNFVYPPKDMLISKLLSIFEEQEISIEKV